MDYNDFGLRVEYIEYTIKKGDSLYSIANKYNTTIELLTDINMLTSSNIYPGQVLLIPSTKNTTSDYYFENYIVNDGDTIEQIANKEGIDPVLIGLYNDFSSYKLLEGQIIKIPKNNTYIIKQSDTLDSIIENTNRTYEQLLRANAFNWLKVGSQIYL